MVVKGHEGRTRLRVQKNRTMSGFLNEKSAFLWFFAKKDQTSSTRRADEKTTQNVLRQIGKLKNVKNRVYPKVR